MPLTDTSLLDSTMHLKLRQSHWVSHGIIQLTPADRE